ncbi:MAG: enoyl-CoA hydratase/isomerase family protein [Chloroflexi bacterium]|nr:enoyl-CoA hydratase/isomerase family protein [Chloroflexota bacterium]
MPPALVDLAIEGHIATITLAAPGALLDRAVSEALAEAARTAAEAPGVRVVIVQGAGSDFAEGWTALALAEPEGVPALPPLSAGIEALAAVPQPTIAAIAGGAHSSGLEIALACDMRIATGDATFGMPDTASGALPRGGGTQRLPRAVGRAHALRLLLTGEIIDAAEARRIGLVSRVVPSGGTALRDAAREWAATIASRGPIATRLAKEAVHRGAEMTLDQALRYETDLTVILQSTADRAEGVRAFQEKRPPHFSGE